MRLHQSLPSIAFFVVTYFLSSHALAHFHASAGRFVERDPVEKRESVNLYEYCLSQPTVRVDSAGTESIPCNHPGGGEGCLRRRPCYLSFPNGCGTDDMPVNPRTGGVDFTPACNEHDTCYDNCAMTKQQCDDAFRSRLNEICRQAFGPNGQAFDACQVEGGRMYTGVALGGGDAFNRARSQGCVCGDCDE